MASAAPAQRSLRLRLTAPGRVARTASPVAQPVAKVQAGVGRTRAPGQAVRFRYDGNTSSVVPADRTCGALMRFPGLHWVRPLARGGQSIPAGREILPVPYTSMLLFELPASLVSNRGSRDSRIPQVCSPGRRFSVLRCAVRCAGPRVLFSQFDNGFSPLPACRQLLRFDPSQGSLDI